MAARKLYDFTRNYEWIVRDALEEAESMNQKINGYGDISDSLTNILYSYDASVDFYGSRVIGIANQGSDLDIFVSVYDGPNLEPRDAYYNGRSRENQIEVLKVLRSSFWNRRDWEVKKPSILYNAAVPILYAYYRPRNLHCEIAVRDGRPVATSELLNHLFSIQPQAKDMFHFIRIWFDKAGIELKGFHVTLLVLFYLQQNNFMPSTARVQENLPFENIRGWPVQFDARRDLYDYGCDFMEDYRDWLVGFFEFYANFDYENEVIFPYFGNSVQKYNFPHQQCLQNCPEDIANFKWQSPMAMAAPFSFDQNVTGRFKHGKLNNFIRVCESAVQILIRSGIH